MFHFIETVPLAHTRKMLENIIESSVILSKYTKNNTPPTMIPQGLCQCKSIRRCLNNGNIELCQEMGQLRKFSQCD